MKSDLFLYLKRGSYNKNSIIPIQLVVVVDLSKYHPSSSPQSHHWVPIYVLALAFKTNLHLFF
jgi:hypothetical protein